MNNSLSKNNYVDEIMFSSKKNQIESRTSSMSHLEGWARPVKANINLEASNKIRRNKSPCEIKSKMQSVHLEFYPTRVVLEGPIENFEIAHDADRLDNAI